MNCNILRLLGTFSGEATLSFFVFFPFSMRSALRGKNLLLRE